MAKDDLKLKDLFTHLVDWIKVEFYELNTRIAANKYTLPQATENTLGGVKIQDEYPGDRDSRNAVTAAYVNSAVDQIGLEIQTAFEFKQDKIKIVTTEPTASSTASDPEGTIYFKV